MDNKALSHVSKIFVGGSRYHRELVKHALGDLRELALMDDDAKLGKADIVYWIYGIGPPPRKYPKLWLCRKPLLILHWIGSDVSSYANKPEGILSKIRRKALDALVKRRSYKGSLVHLAGSPWLAEELSSLGISARYFPVTTIDAKGLRNPNSFGTKDVDFISCVPTARFSFYGGDKLIHMAEKLRDHSFLVVTPGLAEINEHILPHHPENITFIPGVSFEEMQELYLRSKCFLRFIQHDGLSLSILEALFFKLQVFWTYEFPHVFHIKDFTNLHEDLLQAVTPWEPNEGGHEHVVRNFSLEVWKARFQSLVKQITEL